MFLFILGIIVALAGAIWFGLGPSFATGRAIPGEYKDEFGGTRTRMVAERRTMRWPGAVAALLGGLLIVLSCANIVRATEVAVPVRLGVAKEPLSNGLQFNAPWTKLARFGTQVQSRDLKVAVTGSDGGAMDVAVTVRYRVTIGDALGAAEGSSPCSVRDLFKRVRSESALERLVIDRETDTQVRTAFQQSPAFAGYTNQAPVIEAAASTLAPVLAPQCVQLDRLLITRIDPSPQVQQSIDAAIAAAQNVNTARANADSARQAAAGEADAARARAQGAADAAVTAAKGEQTAAEAKAAANRTLAASLTPEVLQAQWIEAMRTSTNRIVVTDGTPPDLIVNDGAAAKG